MELRILLALQDREASLAEFVENFGRAPQAIRPSAGALYARGLLHWRYADEGEESVFSLTHAGRAVIRPLRTTTITL